MELIFTSQNLDKGTYDVKTGTLVVGFKKSQSKYVYQKVPMDVVIDLMQAPSQGIFFNKHIARKYNEQKE